MFIKNDLPPMKKEKKKKKKTTKKKKRFVFLTDFLMMT